MLTGYIAAVVSPFRDGHVDVEAFERYIDHIADSGVSGVAVCGSTGESLSLSMAEKVKLVRIAAAVNCGRVKLVGGIVNSTTEDCVQLIKQMEEHVDYFLCICPFYVKPSQHQIYEHFRTLSSATSRDIILYNNPSRVGADIGFDTFRRLCDLENVVAIKECSLDLSRFSLWRAVVRDGFSFLSGNDDVAGGALAMGANGVISVSANVAPSLCVSMYNEFQQGNLGGFRALRDRIALLHELMFAEPNPAPVKYALSRMGFIVNELRAPLTSISEGLRSKIDEFLIGWLENAA
ncbi:MAG: 4-hydroxy-tetrahydrodipicolinate synthase [Holosporaceae bacterium]|jgi:4-hydroxy-tetrahydrodipicolinate synthase|nr:4-hydroxy-tetrahydrodipicolinate synthase [Holosporaceae bacterium]